MSFVHRYSTHSWPERGANLIEFALLTPVLLLLIFGGVDLARALRLRSLMSAQLRELNIAVFQECVAQSDQSKQQECLNRMIADNSYVFQSILGGARARIGIIKDEGIAGVSHFWAETSPTISDGRSTINIAQYQSSGTVQNNMLISQQYVSYAELETPFRPYLTPIVSAFSSVIEHFYTTSVA